MTIAKAKRDHRRQLGQFITPPALAERVQNELRLSQDSIVLEPSFGDGSFLIPVMRRLVDLNDGDVSLVLREHLFGCEIEQDLFDACVARIVEEFGITEGEVRSGNLYCDDFFRREQVWRDSGQRFDTIIGNPPFGGTFDPDIEDQLDSWFGRRNGDKVKKETYSFFILACVELLTTGGTLRFICSDTFVTIKTMRGLREYLSRTGSVTVENLDHFSEEVHYDLVVLGFTEGEPPNFVTVNGDRVGRELIDLTGNKSWAIGEQHARYFSGWPTVGEFFQCSSGMTIGKNELFVRSVYDGSTIVEPYEFSFYHDPFTVEEAFRLARLRKLGPTALRKAQEREASGELIRKLRVSERPKPLVIELPHDDYRPYNKSSPGLIYEEPKDVVFWRDDGDAVLTFKKTGPWYLRGVGGQPFFEREGATWSLVSSRIKAKYMPPSRILDSGAPVAMPREGTSREEIFFLLGWLVTDKATEILKTVLNHTRNIQGKDVERLPYPAWVPDDRKAAAMALVAELIEVAQVSGPIASTHEALVELEVLYALDPEVAYDQARELVYAGLSPKKQLTIF